MMTYWIKCYLKLKSFHSRKYNWKYRQRNSGHSSCWHIQLPVSLPINKSLSRPQNGGLEIFNWNIKRSSPIMQKVFFMVMTSCMTSQGGLKVDPLYSSINEISTIRMIAKNRTKMSSLNLLYICIMRMWLYLYKPVFMALPMTSPDHKIGQV